MRFLPLLWLHGLLAFSAVADPDAIYRALYSERNWDELEAFQGTASRSFFEEAMDRTYAPIVDWRSWMQVEADGVWIEKGEALGGERLFLRFAGEEQKDREELEVPRGFVGLRIVLDPGHIGGEWGPVEERSFKIGDGPLVQEGDLTLAIAQRLADRLRALGAEVLLTRESAVPTTGLRVEDFLGEAKARLGEGDERLQALAERLFYRTAEIRARADRIEDWGGADLALAIHLNASGFSDPENPELHEANDAHVLINGCYLEGELASPDQRLELLLRLFKGYHLQEERVGSALVESIREHTGLPAYLYESGNAHPLDDWGYLWARNLLASRIFDCPVVYLEPWQANSAPVYEWAAAGDYEGLREFDGQLKPSLPSLYCDFVLAGLSKSFPMPE
ncbi:N-acetylmuramoyl-L-alanine amidase [Pelagicoccus sp. SDUM812002]|uniref:N-acetylmuramoyl-L-alanine amidase n=1 Tax=Pelagicoccus sp. SDUM812002 TaxID=3041266 RepID=UPI00280F874D|nr:N-acetylmuramoyl-L-alanine amidase [Pelagicoccus sp. SDUM812002]MDQ8187120.1 N-acetylmuramoyl-L-alanine amidase [Pelagicoccus sp. SDUM812002]